MALTSDVGGNNTPANTPRATPHRSRPPPPRTPPSATDNAARIAHRDGRSSPEFAHTCFRVKLFMHPSKLDTRQYAHAKPQRMPHLERFKISGQHTLRALTAATAAGVLAWCGAGIANADNHERQACALMDDSLAAIHNGYTTSTMQYAYAVLSTEMPAGEAGHVLAAAAHNTCPNHLADLPAGWS
jgi:hypothetical protein